EREEGEVNDSGEGLADRRAAQAGVPIADDAVEEGEEQSSGGRHGVGPPLEPAHEALGRAQRLDQEQGDQAEDRAEEEGEEDEGRRPEGPEGRLERGDRRRRSADEVSDDAGDQAGEEHGVLDAPERKDLDPEERSRDRRAENRREPRS